MTIYKTAYDTTPCSGFQMKKTVDAIKEAMIREYAGANNGVVLIHESTGAFSQVQGFLHALYIGDADVVSKRQDLAHAPSTPWLAMDMRTTGRVVTPNNSSNEPVGLYDSFKITNSTAYRMQAYRAALTSAWLENGPNAFRPSMPTLIAVFASWLADTIGFRYSLDFKVKTDLKIIAAIFYVSNHLEGVDFGTDENRYLSMITNALKIPANEVIAVYDGVKAIGSMEEFCTKAREYTQSVRLEGLNAGTLVALMGGTWVSSQIELTAVALEHPPTFIGLLIEATTNTVVRKVGLARICDNRLYKEGLEKLPFIIRNFAPDLYRFVEDRLDPRHNSRY